MIIGDGSGAVPRPAQEPRRSRPDRPASKIDPCSAWRRDDWCGCRQDGRIPPDRYPSDLTNGQWELTEPLLPEPNTGARPEKHPRREIVDAILYVVRSGCPWRYLPSSPIKASLDDSCTGP